ncbi:hypothetical protein BASA81_003125 [Batrachochytrium salamandrivorans]|nr:hypothetical protein BASA81_003125 [Batrachochytrium salamandrivorans]
MLAWEAKTSHEPVGLSFASGFENVVETLVLSNQCPQQDRDQILRDIPRTFPNDEYFGNRDVQDTIERVLIAVCLEYPHVGYVQSMNFLCSFLFLHCKSEDACFAMFRVLMEGKGTQMQQMYAPGLPMLFRALGAFEILLDKHAARAMDRMREVKLEVMMFAQTWFMTLFTYAMDWQVCGPVWDMFLQRGWEAMLRAAVVLVKQWEAEIVCGDFESIGELMRQACANAPSDLVERADLLKFDSSDLDVCLQVAEEAESRV